MNQKANANNKTHDCLRNTANRGNKEYCVPERKLMPQNTMPSAAAKSATSGQ